VGTSTGFLGHALQPLLAAFAYGGENDGAKGAVGSNRVGKANRVDDSVGALREFDGRSDRNGIPEGHAIGEQDKSLAA
jgi:hypothetical protein